MIENLIIYDKFEIIKKLNYCSLVKYINRFGNVKKAIILNSINRIVSNCNTIQSNNDNIYLENENNKFEKFKNLITTNLTISLSGEFKLSNTEYICDFPYYLIIKAIYRETGNKYKNSSYRYFDHPQYKLSKNTKKAIKIITKIITKEQRLNIFECKLDKGLIKYNAKQIINLSFLDSLTRSQESPDELSKSITIGDIVDQDIKVKPLISFDLKGNIEPEKKQRSIILTSRNLSIVKFLKNFYKDKCQICGEAIEISLGSCLSEVHHIKPLGVHNGPDVVENTIVLCPNHHAMFDRGAITIDIEKKVVIHFNPENPLNNKQIELKHEINGSYIAFHNQNIFINSAEYQNREEMIFAKDEIAATVQTVDFGNIVTLQDMDTSELFEVRLEDKFNKDFMKPIEKAILQKYLNDIVRYDAFQYKVISIRSE